MMSAETHADAAAQYVQANKMSVGDYYVRKVADAKLVTVTRTTTINAQAPGDPAPVEIVTVDANG
jgi:hypothetical protein